MKLKAAFLAGVKYANSIPKKQGTFGGDAAMESIVSLEDLIGRGKIVIRIPGGRVLVVRIERNPIKKSQVIIFEQGASFTASCAQKVTLIEDSTNKKNENNWF